MQESTGRIFEGTAEEMKKLEGELGEKLKPISEQDAVRLSRFPEQERTAEWHFSNWVTKYYPTLDNETLTKLRHAFKNGFTEAERIFRK